MNKIVQCPQCAKSIEWVAEEKFKPFCSQRCRVIDLGAWADDRYSIPDNQKTALDGDPTDFEFIDKE